MGAIDDVASKPPRDYGAVIGATNDYLTIPGTGEILAYYQTGTGHSWVPFHDSSGSTIALDSTGLTNQYTYDPDGMPWVVTGPQNLFAYLSDGMHFDPIAFTTAEDGSIAPSCSGHRVEPASESPERKEPAEEAGPARARRGRVAGPAAALPRWGKRPKTLHTLRGQLISTLSFGRRRRRAAEPVFFRRGYCPCGNSGLLRKPLWRTT